MRAHDNVSELRALHPVNGPPPALHSARICPLRFLAPGMHVSALASHDKEKLWVLLWHYHDDDVPGPPADVRLEISGLPTTSGTSSFTVTVTDSSQPALTASSEFQIPVTPAHTDLVLSQTAFSFSFFTGATTLPALPESTSCTTRSPSL